MKPCSVSTSFATSSKRLLSAIGVLRPEHCFRRPVFAATALRLPDRHRLMSTQWTSLSNYFLTAVHCQGEQGTARVGAAPPKTRHSRPRGKFENDFSGWEQSRLGNGAAADLRTSGTPLRLL